MDYDLHQVPFSRFGSYMAVSYLGETKDHPAGLYLRSMHDSFNHKPICRIELVGADGSPLAFESAATPAKVTLSAGDARLELCFADADVLRGRAHGAVVRLTPAYKSMIQSYRYGSSGSWCVNIAQVRHQYLLTPIAGKLAMAGEWTGTTSNNVSGVFSNAGGTDVEFAVEEYESEWEKRAYGGSFDECVAAVEKDWQGFLAAMPSVPARFAAARELAAYIDWSCVVAAKGFLKRPAMYMSKNWMCGIWSWDHCFNALALAYGRPELAWDQLMVLFDVQHAQGSLPDISDDVKPLWNFCKPPVHGWALSKMMAANEFFTAKKRLAEIYEPLARWTAWWTTYRDPEGTGLCEYHHGNDSGWDNSTSFAAGVPLVGADLAAFLVVQMDVLADVATRLGKEKDAEEWKRRGGAMKKKMLKDLWRGTRFVSPRRGDGAIAEDGDSLINFMPVVLGKRLPKDVREAVVAGLSQEGRFLTQHGLATENTRSRYYEPDGYWRGPIWAPSTMLAVDGLAASGAAPLATKIAERFCEMCRVHGFAENFDAITGERRRDPAYTWTASVFLVLAHEYLQD